MEVLNKTMVVIIFQYVGVSNQHTGDSNVQKNGKMV